mgnify:CR=1 FL=1
MKLEMLGPNAHELTTKDFTVLFSYNTPVAFCRHKDGLYYRTREKHSNTTQKHITQWLGEHPGRPCEQGVIDDLLDRLC